MQSGMGRFCSTCRKQTLPFSVGFVVFWSLLTELLNPSLTYSVENFITSLEAVEIVTLIILYLLLPLLGFYADLKGRYWILLGSIVLAMVSTSLFVTQSAVNGLEQFVYLMYPLYLFSHASVTIILLTFGNDQLSSLGASSQLMSSYVWWMYWTFHLGSLVSVIAGCSYRGDKAEIYIGCAHFACLIVLFISVLISMRKNWVIIELRNTNSLKTLLKVICYARKKRYPLSRRAVSNWEEDNPSRIDQAKLKYGGPFSEDEVEDVKRLFCLVPFLLCSQMIYFPVRVAGSFEYRKHQEDIKQCLFFSSYTDFYMMVVILIPLLHCLPNRWTFRVSMLYRIAFGLLMSILGNALFIGLDKVTQTASSNETCKADHDNEVGYNSTAVQTYLIMLAPSTIDNIGVLLVTVTSFEFLFAQSPYGMRGLILGMWSMISKLMVLIGWKVTLLVQELVTFYPKCQSYILIMNLSVMCLSFGLYCAVAKCYKLRTRQKRSSQSQDAAGTACLVNYGTLNIQ